MQRTVFLLGAIVAALFCVVAACGGSHPAPVPPPVPPAPTASAACLDVQLGVWQTITPPGVSLDPNLKIPNGFNQYGTGAYALDPTHPGTIYLGTCEQGIWKTTDCGTTWVHINTGRSAQDLDQGMQWTMAIDPVNPQVLFTNAGYSTNALYKSTNGGVDWDKAFDAQVMTHFQFGGFAETAHIDPSDHTHVVVTMHEVCINAAPGCLVESFDSGATWHTVDGAWGGEGENSALDMLDSKTWLYTVPFTKPSGIWRTADSGKTWTQVYDQFPIPGVARGASGALYMPDQQGPVLRSLDNGLTWQGLDGSPNRSAALVVINGTIYESYNDVGSRTMGYQYMAAPESAPTQWTSLTAMPQMTQGAGRNGLVYDPALKILYSGNSLAGFWRVGMGAIADGGSPPQDASAGDSAAPDASMTDAAPGDASSAETGPADAGIDGTVADSGASYTGVCQCTCPPPVSTPARRRR